MRSSSEIRQAFLDYFAAKGHEIVPSSPLIPANDPTLLFTNAGMVQFKDSFLGRETRRYVRAASSQLCVRAGGKHNDLENVGYTARHHTFFEMLGNFSFGDYFKAEAIAFAWEFLTQVLRLPTERLWVTVYADDDEAARIWLDDMGLDPARFSRIGDKPGGRQYESDNFWSMGDTGPCGPCSEIFYDHGPDIWGGPPGTPEEDGDRYIEIWNLVFMQYDRDASGALTPLPKPSVDTGMGLERLCAVLQQVHSNYEIDLFEHLIRAAARMVGTDDLGQKSLRVIADHIRSSAFLILDGVLPSNEGRGYVLRRIIRRAIRHGYQLGQTQAFFHAMVRPLVEVMGAAYPHLAAQAEQVARVLLKEENRFAETLEQGMRILNAALAELQGKTLPGELVFRLYDTYGFPVDLTADIAREQGLALDMAGFEQAMQAQRERARAASHFAARDSEGLEISQTSRFDGYHQLSHQARLVALYRDGIEVESLFEGQEALALLDTTPFYAESGGQVGDTGLLVADSGQAEVLDTRKKNDAILHHIRVKTGELGLGQTLDARVDARRRQAVVLNHSATHLMHAALRKVLGNHVQQKGSLVAPDRLRFDFAHFEPMNQEQIAEVEHLVNAEIRANAAANERLMDKDAAIAAGAMALFGEKYGDEVRVISIGDFSTELCGGCHVERAGDIGLFKIISEAGVAAGVRRLEAVTGEHALRQIAANEGHLDQVATLLKTSRDEVDTKVSQLLERNRRLEKELEALKARLASSKGSSLIDQSIAFDGFKLLAAELEGADTKALRETMDQLKNKLGSAIILLASVADAKVSLVAGVTQDLTGRFKAGDLIRDIAAQVGGKGGGRADMAQAGGNEPAALPKALASVEAWVRARL